MYTYLCISKIEENIRKIVDAKNVFYYEYITIITFSASKREENMDTKNP